MSTKQEGAHHTIIVSHYIKLLNSHTNMFLNKLPCNHKEITRELPGDYLLERQLKE